MITLDFFGTRLTVGSEDGRVLDVLRLLWEPLVREGEADRLPDVWVARTDHGWLLESGRDESVRASDPWVMLDQVRALLLPQALDRAQGIVDLHAGAVVKDDGAVLVVGPPRAGKTSITLELVERGWGYITDDLAPLSQATCSVLPFPKPFGVKDDARWFDLSARWSIPAWLPPPNGLFLVPATAFPLAAFHPSRARAIVFPSFRPDAPPGVEPLTAARAVALCCAYVRRVRPEVIRTLAAVSAAARCFRLAYQQPPQAADLIEEIVRRSP